jgi:hypothetical protein
METTMGMKKPLPAGRAEQGRGHGAEIGTAATEQEI